MAINSSATGAQAMTEDMGAAKVAAVATATASGVAQWLGANLPLYIQCATALTLTFAVITGLYRFWKWLNRQDRIG